MPVFKQNQFAAYILLSNGVVDLFAALALFFPVLGLPLPGYPAYTPQIAFVAGGWGIAALCFGVGRIWVSYRPEFQGMMVILGLLEGSLLTLFCLINIRFLGVALLQAVLPLAVGGAFGILYLLALLRMKKPV